MSSWICGGGDIAVLGCGEIAAWEDVCGREGAGGPYTVEKEYLVGGRDEKDAGEALVSAG
jgi:hypothetical protein